MNLIKDIPRRTTRYEYLYLLMFINFNLLIQCLKMNMLFNLLTENPYNEFGILSLLQQLLMNSTNQTSYSSNRSKMSNGGILSIPLPNTIQPLKQFHSIKPLS